MTALSIAKNLTSLTNIHQQCSQLQNTVSISSTTINNHKLPKISGNKKPIALLSLNRILFFRNRSGKSRISKLDRLPDYLRGTMDRLIGRSRRKGDTNKENRAAPCRTKKAGISLSTHTKTLSQHYRNEKNTSKNDLCVCDSIDNNMLQKLVSLPPGMNQKEWIASHLLPLFDHVNALCGSVSEVCTNTGCNVMSYPGCQKAYWLDDRGKRCVYTAPIYIDTVMSFCEKSRNDENLFPTKHGNDFPSYYEQHCKKMTKLLWHCCGHLYSKHWDDLNTLNLGSQCSMIFAHITCLAKEFNLLDSKDLSAIQHIVNLIRPMYIQNPLATRLSSVKNNQENVSDNSCSTRVPTSKSGSWGGYPTPTILGCKAYAQTC
uniref:MOB kinase activator-like 2 n=1 Tax=Parastrongyloides trichosuri TaxID=131310 RepID=A0A0N4Z437_PARTI